MRYGITAFLITLAGTIVNAATPANTVSNTSMPDPAHNDPEVQQALHDVFHHTETETTDCYHVGGILTYDKQWVVWLNEKVYTPTVASPHMTIQKVTPSGLFVASQFLAKAPPKWVKFNQTYCPKNHTVLSGDQRSS